MELPISVVFEPPSLSELRALLRRRRTWVVAAVPALAIGLVLVVAGVSRAEAEATAGSVPFNVTSRPSGAAIWIDGRARGHTPALLQVAPGQRRLELRSDTAIDAEYMLDVPPDGGEVEARLWRREPSLRRLRPSLPGAVLDSVVQLTDGQLALVTRTSAETELRLWQLDPLNGGIEPHATELPGSTLALTPDGGRVAYIGHDVGPSVGRSTWLNRDRSADLSRSVVWVAPEDRVADAAPRGLWRAPVGEALSDLSWSPTHETLLVVTTTALADGTSRSRLSSLAAESDSDARALLTLPSRVVPGAYAWSPDGRFVVFMAHAGALNALCLLDLHSGAFRYLADLDPSETPPLPYLPVAWSADSMHLLFVAPRQQPATPSALADSWLSGPQRQVLHVAEVESPEPRVVAEVDAGVPVWREDGRIVLAARQREDGALAIQLLDSTGASHTVLRLPLRVGPRYAAAWNTETGQLLVADRTGAATEFWLVGLGMQDRT